MNPRNQPIAKENREVVSNLLVAFATGNLVQYHEKFLELTQKTNDIPLTLLWLEILVTFGMDQESRKRFAGPLLEVLEADPWGRAVGEFLIGTRTAGQLEELVGDDLDRRLPFHYYNGVLADARGNFNEANYHYRVCIRIPASQLERWLAQVAISRVLVLGSLPGLAPVEPHIMSIAQLEAFVDPLDILERATPPEESQNEEAKSVSQKGLYHSTLAQMHRARGDVDEARKHFVQAVDCQRTVSKGRGDLWLAKALSEQAEFEAEQGNRVAALDCFDEAIRIVDDALDEPDPSFAGILVQAAHLASSAGRQKDAERGYRRALALTQKQTGPDSPRAAALMDNLASVLADSGRVGEAEKLYRQAHEIFESVKDECPEDISVNQLGLGRLLLQTGRRDEALELIEESVRIRKTLFPEFHDRIAAGYLALGDARLKLGDYARAEEVLRRALEIRAALFGAGHSVYAEVLGRVAEVCHLRGNEEESIQCLEKVVEIAEKTYGRTSAEFVGALLELAGALHATGSTDEAAARSAEASQVLAEMTGAESTPQNSDLLTHGGLRFEFRDAHTAKLAYRGLSLLKRGDVSLDANEYDAAYRYYCEAQEILRTALPEANAYRLVPATFKLGRLYTEVGQHDKAAELYSDLDASLDIDKRDPVRIELYRRRATSAYYRGNMEEAAHFLGRSLEAIDDDDVATKQRVLTDLANVYDRVGNRQQAEKCAESALALLKAVNDRRAIVAALGNLGWIRLNRGATDLASEAIEEAVRVFRGFAESGEEPPIHVVTAQAFLLEFAGRSAEAFRKFASVIEREEHWLESASLVWNEAKRLAMFQETRAGFDWLMTVYVRSLVSSHELASEVMGLVLRRKGVWADTIVAERDALVEGKYPELREKFEARRRLRLRIARARTSTLTAARAHDEASRAIPKWVAEKERLEEELAQEVKEIRLSKIMKETTPQSIAQRLSIGAVVVEWMRFSFGGLIGESGPETIEDRYVAFLLSPGKTPSVTTVLLEDGAAAIDELINVYRARVGEQSDAEKALGQEVRRKVWDPVESVMGEAKSVFVCPDSTLALISFSVLPTENDGERLIDRYQITYLATARDLLRTGVQPESLGPPVVLGDPRFDWPADSTGHATARSDVGLVENVTGRVHRGADARALAFERLPETGVEVKEIAQLLGVGPPFLWEDAIKSRVMGCNRPSVLHLATHGYSLARAVTIAGGLGGLARALTFGGGAGGGESAHLGTVGEGPAHLIGHEEPRILLTLVGLAFAGATTFVEGKERPHPGCDDGLLSGAEVAELDLDGTELCVISSCNSGVGQGMSGEGVFSLARAFTFAGARTIVVSLWRQDDEAAQRLMIEFYRRMLRCKMPREVAFRSAQQNLRANPKFAHPYYWAGWIILGAGGRLDIDARQDAAFFRASDLADAKDEPLFDEETPPVAVHEREVDERREPSRPLYAMSLRRKHALPEADPRWAHVSSVVAGLVDAGAFEEATQTIESYLVDPPNQAARARALIELVAVLRQSGRQTTELHKKLDEASSLATGFDRGHLAFERGMLWFRDGRLDEAERALRDATNVIEKTVGQEDPVYWITVSAWSRALSNLGRHEEARQRLESIQDRIRREGAGDDEIYFGVVWNLGEVYAELGMFPEAERILRERIQVLGNRPGAFNAYLHLSIVLRSAERLQEADEAARQALNLAKLHHGGTSAELASAYHTHGMVLNAAGRYGEATEALHRSLEILEQRHLVNDHNYVTTKWMLARALENLGKLKDAEHQLRQSLAIVYTCLGGDKYADYWRIRRDVGITLERQGDYDGAQAHFRQMIRTLDAEQAPNDQVLLIALQDLLFCLKTGGSADFKEFESIARRQLTIAQRAYGVEDESRLEYLNNLASALGAQRRFDEAERYLSEAMEIGRRFRGEGSRRQVLHSHVVLTQLKLWQGKKDATESAKVALNLLERTIEPSDPNYNVTRQFLDDVIEGNCAVEDDAKTDGEDGGSDPS